MISINSSAYLWSAEALLLVYDQEKLICSSMISRSSSFQSKSSTHREPKAWLMEDQVLLIEQKQGVCSSRTRGWSSKTRNHSSAHREPAAEFRLTENLRLVLAHRGQQKRVCFSSITKGWSLAHRRPEAHLLLIENQRLVFGSSRIWSWSSAPIWPEGGPSSRRFEAAFQ